MKYLDAQRKAMAGPSANKALPGPVENKAGPDEPEVTSLEGVTFAHPRAREDAVERGLTATSFEGVVPSSDRGFTTADVRAVST